ncbi:unnamed protein product [Rhizophagus irregularis]|uniref:Uncharacterized protein n=2 Tax=Rhizophagus irregularis TaxID=588596 RepID=A0A916E485_9GLOM|nr:unnamed protein product [Rhizophagus irregularis]CAB5186805.1 unnamed protein product [Rhizophagus irregularis]CAB5361174.1 unnamed protein product [Rhizophagus irregularis]
MSLQNQSTTGQKAHRRNTSINNTLLENPVTNPTYLKPIDTFPKKSHLNNVLNDTPPLTPPPTPSKSKKIDKNDGNFDIRNMFFILIFCGSLVVFLGALSGLGPPFDDEIDISIVKVNISNKIDTNNIINDLNDNNNNNIEIIDEKDDEFLQISDEIHHVNNNDNNDVVNNNDEINNHEENENVDFIENTETDIEIVNPELIIKEEKEVDQDFELPPEDDIKPESPIEISDDMKSEKKEDIIDDIEDEGLDPIPLNNDDVSNNNDENKLDQDDKDITFNIVDGLPNKLKNKKNSYQKMIPVRYDESENQDYPKNDYSNYTYMRNKTHFTYDDVVGSLTDEERDDINKTQLLEMNTNESLDSSCGTWQDNYSMLHEKILSGNEAQRYVSYICDDKNNCGGLSDRILGMTSAFVFALLTNRAFLADWQIPFPLETIFSSPNIDWSHDSLNPSSNIRELETSEINVIDFDAKNLDQQFMLSNWTTKYPSPFIKFYSNRGMIIRSFDSKYYSQSLKDMGLRPHTTFGCVVDYLFRPAPSALSFITQYTSLFALPSIFTVGIQINAQNGFTSLQDYNHYFNCADQLTQTYAALNQKVIYYLVTDSSELRNEAVQKFEHLVVSGLPTDSNLDNLDNPDNVINAMIESWIFSKTDYRIISSGNYGKLSAFYSKQLHTTVSIGNDNQALDCSKEDTFITFIKLASESSLG